MNRWYVAATHPKAEALAAHHLANQGFDCYLPVIRSARIVRHLPVEITQPAFPSYIFVAFDVGLPGWPSINGTRGVNKLLANSQGKPVPLRDGAIDLVREDLAQRPGGSEKEPAPWFKPGQELVVISGPFFGHAGLCKMSRAERVSVLLTLFGRETEIPLRADQVQAA
jgi:transcriptional antiterminator RfaH